MRTNFVLPGYGKKRHGRSRLSDDVSMRMALWTHNLPSGRLKKTLVNSMKRNFKVSKAMHPVHQKNNLEEVP
jgi:hypothetical protein